MLGYRQSLELSQARDAEQRRVVQERLLSSTEASRRARRLWAGAELGSALREAKRSVELVLEALDRSPSGELADALASEGETEVAGSWDLDNVLRTLLDAQRQLAKRARFAAMDPSGVRRYWQLRVVRVAVVATVLAFLLWRTVRTEAEIVTTGSPTTQLNFHAIYATDGNPRTEWQPDDHRSGWVELRLTPPRRVEGVRILNGHNRHYDDRATKEFEVELFSDGRRAASAEGTFYAIRHRGEWRTVEVAGDAIDRIRVTAKTWHGRSPAIGEIEVR
ncbi:MAG: discoidin domain-containing protein [Myxococcota bacterium]